jgi:hypothetical protein
MGIRELNLQSDHALGWEWYLRLDTTATHGKIGDRALAGQDFAGEGAPKVDVESRALSMISHADKPAGV